MTHLTKPCANNQLEHIVCSALIISLVATRAARAMLGAEPKLSAAGGASRRHGFLGRRLCCITCATGPAISTCIQCTSTAVISKQTSWLGRKVKNETRVEKPRRAPGAKSRWHPSRQGSTTTYGGKEAKRWQGRGRCALHRPTSTGRWYPGIGSSHNGRVHKRDVRKLQRAVIQDALLSQGRAVRDNPVHRRGGSEQLLGRHVQTKAVLKHSAQRVHLHRVHPQRRQANVAAAREQQGRNHGPLRGSTNKRAIHPIMKGNPLPPPRDR